MDPTKFCLEDYLKSNTKSWPNLEKSAKSDLDYISNLSKDQSNRPVKIDELTHLVYNDPNKSVISNRKEHIQLLGKIDKTYEKLGHFCQMTFVSIGDSHSKSSDLEANLKKSSLGIHQKISESRFDRGEKQKVESTTQIIDQLNDKLTPYNIPLPLDNLGLGTRPHLPVALSPIIIKVLDNQQFSSLKNKKQVVEDIEFLSKLLLSSCAKSFFSKLFWALLIKIFRIKPVTAFNKGDSTLKKSYEGLMDEIAWDYINLQDMFTEYPNDKIFLVFCGLVCQIIFMIFHQSFKDEVEDKSNLYVHQKCKEEDNNEKNKNYTSQFGKHFLVCLTIEIFTLINGNRPNLNIISMFPMIKLTDNHFDDNDFENLPHGAKKILGVHFPKADFNNNSGSGTIILGLMSGLLERYCQKNRSGGVGQAVGVLSKRKMRRTLI